MANSTTAVVARLEVRIAALEARVAAIEAGPVRAQATAGELLRRRRLALGHTQLVAAAQMGVDQSTVSKWERGARIGWDNAADVADYIDIPPAVLLASNP